MLDNSFLTQFDNPPRWARTWCYFYLLAASMLAMSAFFTLLMLIFAYGKLKKGQASLLMSYSLAFVFQALSAMVMFWMCRSSLKQDK